VPLQVRQPLGKSSLSEQAYELLRQEIISGSLAPGEKLNIHELADHLQISRTPLKEAINRLAEQGLVTIRSRRATFVSTIEAAKIREVFDVRLMIELWAAERACHEQQLLDLKRMEETLKQCGSLFSAEASFDHATFNQADMNFHRSIVRAAQNTHLSKLYDSLSVHIQAMRVYWGQARRPALDSHNEHFAIFNSFLTGGWEDVRHSLTIHIVRSRDDVIRVLNDRSGHSGG
jgi:GntR family transcriptional regulator, rspAB operon transcriptional repressor